MRRSLTVLSTRDCRAAWSIGLSADEPAVEADGGGAPAPGDAVGVDTVCVDGTGTVAHAAMKSATPHRTIVTYRCLLRRCGRDGTMHVCMLVLHERVTCGTRACSG